MRLLLCLCVLSQVRGYSTDVGAGKKECFVVRTTRETTVTGNFEVLDDETELIAVTVIGPGDKVHYETRFSGKGAVERRHSEGTFDFDADADGDYTMCIHNGTPEKNDGQERTVGFNFREMDLTDEEDMGGEEYTGLENEMYDLQRGLDFLTDHQSYMNQREDLHKEELESISRSVLIWTVLEAVILVGLAAWQISYVRGFFETKRRL